MAPIRARLLGNMYFKCDTPNSNIVKKGFVIRIPIHQVQFELYVYSLIPSISATSCEKVRGFLPFWPITSKKIPGSSAAEDFACRNECSDGLCVSVAVIQAGLSRDVGVHE